MWRTRMLAAAVAVLVVAGVAGCGMGGPDDRTIRFYTTASPSMNDRLEKAFERAHPQLDLEVTRGASDLVPKVDAEIASGADGADVVLYTGDSWYLKNTEHLAPIAPAAAAGYPAWGVPGLAPVVSYSPFSMIVWNTDVFPDGFRSWDDLLKPEVTGRLGVRDTMTQTLASYLQYLQDVNGAEYLSRLAAQHPRFYPSLVPMAQAVASGEVGVANMASPSVIKELQARGAPIRGTLFQQGWAAPFHAAIPQKSVRQEAAQTFVAFLMSPEGQAAFNGNEEAGSPLPGIEGTIDVSDMVTVSEANAPSPFIKEWAGRFRGIFQRG